MYRHSKVVDYDDDDFFDMRIKYCNDESDEDELIINNLKRLNPL